ncbi:hypothetical protein PF003_g5566 [Phytophthora fragariae]|nr:hypothetical protein PF003_g5566 [Phytophthora fragariae]
MASIVQILYVVLLTVTTTSLRFMGTPRVFFHFTTKASIRLPQDARTLRGKMPTSLSGGVAVTLAALATEIVARSSVTTFSWRSRAANSTYGAPTFTASSNNFSDKCGHFLAIFLPSSFPVYWHSEWSKQQVPA